MSKTPKKLKIDPQSELKAEARKFLSLSDLFPKSRPDFRKKWTPYQAKKVRDAIAEVKKIGGMYQNDLVPMGRGRKKYLQDRGLPEYMAGIFLPGGTKVNADLEYTGGAVRYSRGGKRRERYQIDTFSEETVRASVRDIWGDRPARNTAAITANGRVIKGTMNIKNQQILTTEALYIFNKYAEMSAAGEYRTIRTKNGTMEVLAAHPSVWGMGVLFEPAGAESYAAKEAEKAKAKKQREKERAKNAAKKKAGKGRSRK